MSFSLLTNGRVITDFVRNSLVAGAILLSTITTSFAIEGGTQTYLLGVRDSFAGIVPGPGVYFNNDLVFYTGAVPELVIGGVGVVEPDVGVFLWRPNVTFVYEATLWGGTPALSVSLPVVAASMDAEGVVGGFTGSFTDKTSGVGDLSITTILGWHNGKIHTSVSVSFYLPLGKYEPASVDIGAKTASVLNLGKNRFAVDPTVSVTYFDPDSGFEISGSLGVTVSAKNSATQYQTAPEFHLEAATMFHLAHGIAIGLTGYAYKQFSEDSGPGADQIKDALDLASLKAEAYGLGPVVTYSTKIGNQPINIKAKYIKEFSVKRAFEVDKFWLTFGFVF